MACPCDGRELVRPRLRFTRRERSLASTSGLKSLSQRLLALDERLGVQDPNFPAAHERPSGFEPKERCKILGIAYAIEVRQPREISIEFNAHITVSNNTATVRIGRHDSDRGARGKSSASHDPDRVGSVKTRLLDELSGWVRCFWVVGLLLNPVGRAFPVDVTGGGQGRAL